jgi:hypothetical protein
VAGGPERYSPTRFWLAVIVYLSRAVGLLWTHSPFLQLADGSIGFFPSSFVRVAIA